MKICVNQWKSSKTVIQWFSGIQAKSKCSFIKFDVIDFYPSISQDLFEKAIQFARQHTTVTETDLQIILQARKTLLYHNGEPWTKKNNESNFDVPMGSYDGAEICELVGIFMLSELSGIIDKADIGLYRDDGLGVMRGISKPEIERRKKAIIQIFKRHGLSITVCTGMSTVDYLDVEFDLKNSLYKPYKKPNSTPIYVHKDSNHPPTVLKQIPRGIAQRLSDNSSNQAIYQQAAPEYTEALRRGGFIDELAYCQQRLPRRNRKRKVIWFNPPYSANVKTNIGKEFLKLLRTHFHKKHAFHCIYNKHSVKLSYSCTKNVSSIINGHNRRTLQEAARQEACDAQRTCNCRNKDDCPLQNECLTKNIVYEATVKSTGQQDDDVKSYIGLCSTSFKERLAVHKQHIKNRVYRNKCELANYVWDLKDAGKNFDIKWRILKKVRGRLVGGACRLCTTELLFLVEYPEKRRLLNTRFIEKCRHNEKFSLASVASRSKARESGD